MQSDCPSIVKITRVTAVAVTDHDDDDVDTAAADRTDRTSMSRVFARVRPGWCATGRVGATPGKHWEGHEGLAPPRCGGLRVPGRRLARFLLFLGSRGPGGPASLRSAGLRALGPFPVLLALGGPAPLRFAPGSVRGPLSVLRALGGPGARAGGRGGGGAMHSVPRPHLRLVADTAERPLRMAGLERALPTGVRAAENERFCAAGAAAAAPAAVCCAAVAAAAGAPRRRLWRRRRGAAAAAVAVAAVAAVAVVGARCRPRARARAGGRAGGRVRAAVWDGRARVRTPNIPHSAVSTHSRRGQCFLWKRNGGGGGGCRARLRRRSPCQPLFCLAACTFRPAASLFPLLRSGAGVGRPAASPSPASPSPTVKSAPQPAARPFLRFDWYFAMFMTSAGTVTQMIGAVVLRSAPRP
eukprot:gene23037-biopygen16312